MKFYPSYRVALTIAKAIDNAMARVNNTISSDNPGESYDWLYVDNGKKKKGIDSTYENMLLQQCQFDISFGRNSVQNLWKYCVMLEPDGYAEYWWQVLYQFGFTRTARPFSASLHYEQAARWIEANWPRIDTRRMDRSLPLFLDKDSVKVAVIQQYNELISNASFFVGRPIQTCAQFESVIKEVLVLSIDDALVGLRGQVNSIVSDLNSCNNFLKTVVEQCKQTVIDLTDVLQEYPEALRTLIQSADSLKGKIDAEVSAANQSIAIVQNALKNMVEDATALPGMEDILDTTVQIKSTVQRLNDKINEDRLMAEIPVTRANLFTAIAAFVGTAIPNLFKGKKVKPTTNDSNGLNGGVSAVRNTRRETNKHKRRR